MLTILPALVLYALALFDAAGSEEPFKAPREVPTPAANESMAPQLAASPDGRLFLSWLEPAPGGGHRFRFAERLAVRWSEPRTIHEGEGLFANWADVPSLFAGNGGVLVAHWLQQVPGGKYAYGIRMRSSADGGLTWSSPVVPHRDASPTEHGFLSFFDWPGGGVGLVWLDGRQTGPETHADGHAARGTGGGRNGHGGLEAQGAMSLRATTFQPPSRLGEDVLLDDRVCDCCPTAAARTSDGVLIAYRGRTESEVRDILVARYEKGRWIPGRAVHDDGWKIPACPVNGPAVAADGRRVVVAWFTAADDQPRVMVAFSPDGGATFGAPVKVNEAATLGRVEVEWLPDGEAMVVWLESEGGLMHVRARRVSPDGRLGLARNVARVPGTRASGYPRVARSGDDLVFAWRTADPTPRIATAVARLR